jgi:hypothetical protein
LSPRAAPLAGCTVPEGKITGYLLDPDHRFGGPKARFFLALGFSQAEWRAMAAALAAHPALNPIESTTTTRHGAKYVVRCSLATPDGRNPCVVTVWMKDGDSPPRLVTAYPA